jgi:hypothetical protein
MDDQRDTDERDDETTEIVCAVSDDVAISYGTLVLVINGDG